MRIAKLIVHETYQGKRKREDALVAMFLSKMNLNKKIAVEKILKIIEKAQYSDDIVIKLGTGDANINEIIDIANENSIFEISQSRTYSVGYIKETIAPMYDHDFKLCISSEEGNLLIDDIGNVENNNDA